jgi:hypothetical protein
MRNDASHGVGQRDNAFARQLLVTGMLAAAVVLVTLVVPAFGLDNQPASSRVLNIGVAEADIAPSQPVALDGQFGLRVSHKPDTPITANIVALESRDGDRSLDAAVMVSCDLVAISDLLLERVRQATRKCVPDLDLKKVFLNATHTHTAPVTRPGVYDIPKTGVIQVEEYCDFAGQRIAEGIAKAWKGRKPGKFSFGLAHAAVAENRRATYADGRTVMYGKTDQADFRGLEGYEDHDLGTLFFWDEAGKLIAVVVNVSCPSQEVEGLSSLNADFWHPVRQSLRKRYGQDLCVLGWAGTAGDQSPHLMYRKSAEERMRQLRKLTRVEELARRIVAAVDESFETVKNERYSGVPLVHKVATLQLPMRLVTDAEYAEVKAAIAQENPTQMRNRWHRAILDRYEKLKTDPHPTMPAEIHVLRIGDAVVCTNSFELFVDFGVQIKARSRAVQTFLIQLVPEGPLSYLATERAVRGGGYSAVVQSNLISPQGGQMLVDRTVELIDSMWGESSAEKK